MGDISERKRDYHAARARAELESAYRATRPESAALHLELSSMHLREALSFGASPGRRSPCETGWLQSFAPAHGQWLRRDQGLADRAAAGQEWPPHDDSDAPKSDRSPHTLSIRWPQTVEVPA